MVETMIHIPAEKLKPKEATRTVIDSLLPRTVYSFNVSAYFLDSHEWGPPRRIDVETLDGNTYLPSYVKGQTWISVAWWLSRNIGQLSLASLRGR